MLAAFLILLAGYYFYGSFAEVQGAKGVNRGIKKQKNDPSFLLRLPGPSLVPGVFSRVDTLYSVQYKTS